MHDSHFETSGIRKLIIKATGIDIFEIENYEFDNAQQDTQATITINFKMTSLPGKIYKLKSTRGEFNKLCESDFDIFGSYFQQFVQQQQASAR